MCNGIVTAPYRCFTEIQHAPKLSFLHSRAGLVKQSALSEDCSRRGIRQAGRIRNKRRRSWVPQASESQAEISQPYGPGTVKELPVFPLGVVAFPTGDVPLNIFEARYRVLFNTLLAGSKGIEEELVNYQKPWQGSRLFGMCYVSEQGMASVGTTLHILQHERLPDGRLFVMSKGVEKFKVLKVLEERPVMICQVKMLEDSDDRSQMVQELADHDLQLFKDLVLLNVKTNRRLSPEKLDSKLDGMSPREISYWLGLVFAQNPVIQQALLEEPSLEKRLLQEREILEASTKFLRAKVALETAFSPDEPAENQATITSTESAEKPAGDTVAIEKAEDIPDKPVTPEEDSGNASTDPEQGSDQKQ